MLSIEYKELQIPFENTFKYQLHEQDLNYTPNIVITGDLNMNLLSENRNILKDIIEIYNIRNYINDATRYDVDGQVTLLDPVLVSPAGPGVKRIGL